MNKISELSSTPFSRWEPFKFRLEKARKALPELRFEDRGVLTADRRAKIVPWLKAKIYTRTLTIADYNELWEALGITRVGNFTGIAVIESLTGELGNFAWTHLTLHDVLRFKHQVICFGLAQRFWGTLEEYAIQYTVSKGVIVTNTAVQVEDGKDYLKFADDNFYYYVGKSRQVNDSNQQRMRDMWNTNDVSFGYFSATFNILMVRRNVYVDSTNGAGKTTELGSFS